MYIKSLYSILILIQILSCNSLEQNKTEQTKELYSICENFAKSICTKDTMLFYKLVDKNKLVASMNNWIQNKRKIEIEDLHFPFFFVYSPLKIRQENLINARSQKQFFTYFKIESIKNLNETEFLVSLKWKQKLSNNEEQMINITLQKNDSLKIIDAKWEI